MSWLENPHIINNLTPEDLAAAKIWEAARQEEKTSIVFVANKGIHPIDEGQFGDAEIVYVTEGNLGGNPFNQKSLNEAVIKAIQKVAKILKTRRYDKVFVVPTGLPIVSLAIQAVITQVASKAPGILQYDRESGEYWEMEFEYRQIISDTDPLTDSSLSTSIFDVDERAAMMTALDNLLTE